MEHFTNHIDINDVLSYECDDIIDGFRKNLDISINDSREIFTEMLKWMWYCTSPNTVNSREIDSSLLIIDEMWHTFILYTTEYSKFCTKYFNRYIHHSPTKSIELIEHKKSLEMK